MTRQYVVCIAGLSQDLFDRAQAVSATRFVPTGQLILKKYPDEGYSAALAGAYISEAAAWVRKQSEPVPISTILLYVNHLGESTSEFVDRFFPFALTIPIAPIDLSSVRNPQSFNTASNKFIDALKDATLRARRMADAVSFQLKDEHRTPLLLPVRNFRSKDFRPLLEDAYRRVGVADDIPAVLRQGFAAFQRKHIGAFDAPNGKQLRCFTDDDLYFIGPGKDRHGYFRHTAKGHHDECVLTAKSRLGGTFAHDFHFDCQPARPLKALYPNCHDEDSSPKPTHVNIAPNDYVI